MYSKVKFNKSRLTSVDKDICTTIEERIAKLRDTETPITDGAPLIYDESEDSPISPEHDVRTDFWELAAESRDNMDLLKTKIKSDIKFQEDIDAQKLEEANEIIESQKDEGKEE